MRSQIVLLLISTTLLGSREAAAISWPEWSADADLEFTSESQGTVHSSEITFDEVGLGLEADWWSAEAGIKYESDGDRGLIVEEAAARVGGTEDWPWFVQFGRTVLPFGEFESRFVEDPLVALVAETDETAVSIGGVNELFELTAAGYRGNHAGPDDFDFAASGVLTAFDGWRMGMSWSSDLSESVEIRELRDSLEEDALGMGGIPSPTATDAVPALSGFVSFEHARWFLHAEYATGLASLEAGHLAPGKLRPSAWNLEGAVRLGRRAGVALRLEASNDLPEAPPWQYGVAGSFEFNEQVSLIGDYLRGDFDVGVADRNLFSLKLALEY